MYIHIYISEDIINLFFFFSFLPTICFYRQEVQVIRRTLSVDLLPFSFPKPLLTVFELFHLALKIKMGLTMTVSLVLMALGIHRLPDAKMAQGHRALPIFQSRVKTLAKITRKQKETERRRGFHLARAENEKWRHRYVFNGQIFKSPYEMLIFISS